MKSLLHILACFITITFLSCVGNRHSDTTPIRFSNPAPVTTVMPAPQPVPQGVPMTNCCPEDMDSMIPFTRDLYNSLRVNNQDIRKLQFFIDQTIILSRGLSQDKLYIDNGKIVNQYGVNENRIELPALTPGVVDAIEPDGLRIAFESGNNIKFINNKYSPEFFVFTGTNWDNGTAEIPYRNTVYRASCATCGSVSEARLVVRRKDIMTGSTNISIIGGKTIR